MVARGIGLLADNDGAIMATMIGTVMGYPDDRIIRLVGRNPRKDVD